MADGGASSIIMLVAALITAGIASAVIIQNFTELVLISEKQAIKAALDEGCEVSIAGDPLDVDVNTVPNPDEITFYLINSGTEELDTTTISLFDGSSLTLKSASSSVLSGGDWVTGEIYKVVATADFTSYSDGDEGVLVITSNTVDGTKAGSTGTCVTSGVIRLDI